MRRIAVVAVLLLALTPRAEAATTVDVGIADFRFRNGACPLPAGNNVTTIQVGDTVRWTNCDAVGHNVTWKQVALPNKTMQGGQSAQQVFSRSGFYDYYCSIHGTPTGSEMQGRVVVQGSNPTTTKATAPPTTATTVPPATTTSAPPTTAPPASTTSSSSTTIDTTTTTIDQAANAPKDEGANGLLVALLLVAIAAAIGGGVYLVRRMQQENIV